MYYMYVSNVQLFVEQRFYYICVQKILKQSLQYVYYSLQNPLQIQHEGLRALFLGPDRVFVYGVHYHHYHGSPVPQSLFLC